MQVYNYVGNFIFDFSRVWKVHMEFCNYKCTNGILQLSVYKIHVSLKKKNTLENDIPS